MKKPRRRLRSAGTNARVRGTNSRAKGTNPRAVAFEEPSLLPSFCDQCGQAIWPVPKGPFHLEGWSHYEPPCRGAELHTALPVRS